MSGLCALQNLRIKGTSGVATPRSSSGAYALRAASPVIRPEHPVRTGNLYRAQRVWCALDLLLTCESIREARDKTQERLASAGEA